MVRGLGNTTGDLVGRLVDVPQPVGLVDNHQVPLNMVDFIGLGGSEVVRANDDLVLVKGIGVAFAL